MAKKTPIDKLDAALTKILKEYEGEVMENIEEITKKFAQKGAQAVKAEAKAKGWGENTKYPNGWSFQFEKLTRYSQQGVIYNKNIPGLAHLLENGHAMRQGGRATAKPHIAPVEDKITEEFYKAVRDGI